MSFEDQLEAGGESFRRYMGRFPTDPDDAKAVDRWLIGAYQAASSKRRDLAYLALTDYSRARAGVRGAYSPVILDRVDARSFISLLRVKSLVPQWRAKNAILTLPDQWDNPLAALIQQEALRLGAVQGAGLFEEVIAGGYRETHLATLRNDPRAKGYARIGETNMCAFCAMLISRGPVYKKDTSAFRSHGHCRCSSRPFFSDGAAWDDQATDLAKQWAEVTKDLSPGDAQRAWRAHIEGREFTGPREGEVAARTRTKGVPTQKATTSVETARNPLDANRSARELLDLQSRLESSLEKHFNEHTQKRVQQLKNEILSRV